MLSMLESMEHAGNYEGDDMPSARIHLSWQDGRLADVDPDTRIKWTRWHATITESEIALNGYREYPCLQLGVPQDWMSEHSQHRRVYALVYHCRPDRLYEPEQNYEFLAHLFVGYLECLVHLRTVTDLLEFALWVAPIISANAQAELFLITEDIWIALQSAQNQEEQEQEEQEPLCRSTGYCTQRTGQR